MNGLRYQSLVATRRCFAKFPLADLYNVEDILAAVGERLVREPRPLAKLALASYFRGDLLTNVVDEGIEFLHRSELNTLATIKLVEAFLGG